MVPPSEKQPPSKKPSPLPPPPCARRQVRGDWQHTPPRSSGAAPGRSNSASALVRNPAKSGFIPLNPAHSGLTSPDPRPTLSSTDPPESFRRKPPSSCLLTKGKKG
eukprot:9476888-Pyramimonas_sp.AAC.1